MPPSNHTRVLSIRAPLALNTQPNRINSTNVPINESNTETVLLKGECSQLPLMANH